MKQLKKVLVLILSILILGSSSIAYSWWDRLSFEDSEIDIVQLGKGLELVVLPVTINPLTSGNLIPESGILTENRSIKKEQN